MKTKPEDYLKEPYSRVLLPEEDGRFSAEILEFPGCFAQGDNPNEAFNNLEVTARSWIEASLEQGLDIPPPALNQGYSGKISLRLPRSLHKRAAQYAERDATSLNQFLVSAIASRIGAEEFSSNLIEKIEKSICYVIYRTIANTQFNTLTVQTNLNQNVFRIKFNVSDTNTLLTEFQSPVVKEVANNREVFPDARGNELCIQL